MKENKKGYPLYQRVLSLAMAAVLTLGVLPVQSLAAETESYPVDHITTVADPQTLGRPGSIYGDDTLHAGKVTVGKSVHNGAVTVDYGTGKQQTFTPGQDNFIVTSSQAAQVVGLLSESAVPVDVVFVLDTSGSMTGGRSTSMVTAANAAIRSLMEANENNRIGVVAFSSNARSDNTTAAEQLSALAHYDDNAATNHLRWGNSRGTVTNNGSYIIGRGTGAGTRHGIDGGTNIHAGIALAADMLMSTTSTTVQVDGNTVNRMPFLVVLSDGAPTYSSYTSNGSDTNWYDPNMTAERGDGNNPYAGNGFLAALTAAYYKGRITEKYFGSNANEQNRCYIYTIGVGLDGLTGNAKALAQITMNPKEYFKAGSDNNYYDDNGSHDFDSYWTKYTAANPTAFSVQSNSGNSTTSISVSSINATKGYVNGLNASGTKMYNGGLAYNDDYYTANQTSDIAKAFEKAVLQIQQQSMSSPTRVEAAHGADFSGYVTYTDPIGEYMEVKDVFGVVANGNLYQGKSFAQYISNWDNAPEEFKTSMIKVLRERCKVTGATMTDAQAVAFIKAAAASENQAYYTSASDYDNSIVWWGKSYTAPEEEDVQVQWLGFADNDTVEYITDSNTSIPEGADYVCRSYYFYGEAGGTAQIVNHDYLHFVVRVQRSLKAPYQETVVISSPASLLSMEKVMITEKTDADGTVSYTATITEADPARVVYEVGLRSDINAFNVEQVLKQDAAYLGETTVTGGQTVNPNYDAATGTYHFYTNDWNRSEGEGEHHRAMTHATFDAAPDNSFYTYTKDTPLYVKNGDTYTLYNGAEKPVGEFYYVREYYDWSASTAAGDTHTAVKKTAYILVDIPAGTEAVKKGADSWYVAKGAYKASSLSTAAEDVMKSPNATGTATIVVHPHRTEAETNSHYTVLLGNNGKLSISSADTKSVNITKPDSTIITDADGKVVMVGDTLTYRMKVVNGGETAADAVVTDTIPLGTAYVEGSADNGGVYDPATKTITWNIADIPAGSYTEVSFQVTVTEEALSGEFGVASIDNTAKVTLDNGFAYETNPVTNYPEGKKVVDTEGNPITGNMEVPQILVYRIRWHNDTGTTADVTVNDIIPAGTTYVAGSADEGGVYDAANQTITWTFKDVKAGTSGVVSFRVSVNASAGETVENGAAITVGNNPRVTNKTQVKVSHGDLVLSKTVEANGFSSAMDQEFTLHLTEISQTLDGTYKMLRNGAPVDGGITFRKGIATVTIRHGDTVEIQGIPAGAVFSVVENAKNGFTASYTVTGSNTPSATEGRVTIAADSDVTVAVTNSYAPSAVNFQLKGSKQLVTNLPLLDTVFGFAAYGCDANGENLNSADLLTGEVTVSADSKNAQIVFSPKVFATVGTYYYLISEINGGVTGIDYADNQYLLTVEVTDNGSGALQTSATLQQRANAGGTFGASTGYTDTGVSFVNTYAPLETQVTLVGTKTLTGRTLKAEEFSFVVKEGDKVVSNGLNAADGSIVFRPITYTAPGTYTYTVTEVGGGLKGVAYDTTSFTVTVTVVDNGGKLEASVAYPTGGVAFENTYTPDDVSVTLTGTKTLTGRDLVAGEFDFVVTDDATGKIVATGSNDVTGKITFTAIGYTLADVGKHTYTVKEVVPDLAADPNMYYDPATFQVKVTVTYDAQTGVLAASEPELVGASAIVFANIQNPDSVEIKPVGNKTTVSAPGDVSFSFSVINTESGNEAGTGVGAANGSIEFSTLSYSDPGTYTYWIVESNAGNTTNGITYDHTRYLMKVEVSRNANNKLEAAVTYWASTQDGSTNVADYTTSVAAPAFENSYAADGYINIEASKILTGNRELKVGDFAFKLYRQDNNGEIDGVITAVTGNNGTVEFATMYYSLADLGGQDTATIHYVMTEVIPNAAKIPGVTYDTNSYDVYVKLTDNGNGAISAELVDAQGNALGSNHTGVTFTNRYAPVEGTSATMEATKVLTGRTLKAGEFGFELFHVTAQGENLVATATNAANGKVSFTRNYPATMAAGQYKYVMREVKGNLGGMTYSDAEYWIVVTITDNTTTGKLESSVKYYADKDCTQEITDLTTVRFSNTYDAHDTTYTPSASKTLTNRHMVDNEFSFVVKEGDKVVSSGLSKADGTVVFTPIGYTDAGTYNYTISEVKGNLTGVGYTDAVYYLTVEVTDNLDGTMTAVGTYYTDGSRTQVTTNVVFENTFTPNPASVQLHAGKTLTGRDMTQGEFSFVVKLGDQVVATGGNAAAAAGTSANVVFSNIGYKLEDLEGATSKDFIYTISELKTSQGGVTFDETVFYAKVTVTNNLATGRLESAVSYYSDAACQNKVEAVAFQNSYAPAGTQLELPVDKTLINKVLEAGEFTFTLKDAEGNVLQTKTNGADGIVSFDAISFTKPGTYIYTVSEAVTDGTKTALYTMDSAVTVVVTVVDDLKGNLIATATYHENDASGNYDPSTNLGGVEFINSYTAPALTVPLSAAIGVDKTVKTPEGVTYSPAGFEFEVTDASGNIVMGRDANGDPVEMIGVSDENGNITFPDFYFSQAGAYIYWLQEKESGKNGITDDTAVRELHILVRYNETTGLLYVNDSDVHVFFRGKSAEESGDTGFVNVYQPAPAAVNLTAKKVLEGRELKSHEFVFYLMEGDLIVAEGYNDAEGNVTFTLNFTEAGNHSYTVKELIPENGLGGVTYDETSYGAISLEVKDDGNGQLVVYAGSTALDNGATVSTGVTITNRYEAAKTTAQIQGHKVLNGNKVLVGGEFTFTLVNTDDPTDTYTAANDAKGKVLFDVEYTKPGVYTYTMRETNGTMLGVTYDTSSFTVTVTVTDDLQGRLQAEVSYPGDVVPTFVNEHETLPVEIVLEGSKELTGRDLKAEEFSFEVRDGDGNVVATAKNGADGKITFSGFQLEETGVHIFSITEVKGNEKGMVYDTTKFAVSVEVTEDNGDLKAEITYPRGGVVFKNTYEKPDPTNPGTGDETPLFLLLGLLLCSSGALAAMLILRKRRNCR